jgi:hypothetical protein
MSDYYGDAVVPDMLASVDQFTAWATRRGITVPDNATALLLSCTILVIDATDGAYYDTDSTTGLATDPLIGNALADATCIQAAAWAALGIDPVMGGTATVGVRTAKGIGSARVSYADAAQAADARALATVGLVPDAERRLRQVNLIGAEPWTFG